jgi:hypothetical protein
MKWVGPDIDVEAVILDNQPVLRVSQLRSGRPASIVYFQNVQELAARVDLATLTVIDDSDTDR